MAVVATTWRAVHSHPAAPKGIRASGIASTAANGGYVKGSSCGASVSAAYTGRPVRIETPASR